MLQKKQLELGDRMDLASYLLKPVQRMGKYALLLQQLVKAQGERGEATQVGDLRAAEAMVRFQLRHGNDLLAMDSLRDCDVSTLVPKIRCTRGSWLQGERGGALLMQY